VLVILNKHKLGHRLPPFYSLSKASNALLCALLLIAFTQQTHAVEEPPSQEATAETQQPDKQTSTDTETESDSTDTESESSTTVTETESDITDAEPSSDTSETEIESETSDTETAPDTSDAEPATDISVNEPEPPKRLDPESACDRTQDFIDQETTWYDSAHAVVNTVFCEPAVWFDDFFASDRIFEEVAGTYVRWRNDFIYNQESGYKFQTNLNFSIELPRISSKLKLIFEGDEDQALQDVLPSQQAESSNNTLGLRLDVKDTDRSRFNISLSAKPRIRLRYRYTYPVRNDFLIRFTQEVQNEKGVNGARTRVDFEKAFLPLKLFRSTTEVFVTEDFPGADLSQAFSLFKRISKKSSVSYEASAVGITRPENLVTNYRLGIRYRQSIHRDWLFLEVTPDITWPITLSEDRETIINDRRSVYSIIVRLEVHFGNAKKRKYSDYF